MKWMFWLLAIITVVAALPAAHAGIRVQGFSNSLLGQFSSVSATIHGDGNSGVLGWDNDYAYAAANTPAVTFGLSAQRPSTVVQHRYADQNQNYRTVEYGDWQVRQAGVNFKKAQTAVEYDRTYAGSSLSGYINGYSTPTTNGYARGLNTNSYGYRYNTNALQNPWVSSPGYSSPGTLSAYVSPVRSYR